MKFSNMQENVEDTVLKEKYFWENIKTTEPNELKVFVGGQK